MRRTPSRARRLPRRLALCSPSPRAARTCCRSIATRCSNDPTLASAQANWEATQEARAAGARRTAAERRRRPATPPATATTRRSTPTRSSDLDAQLRPGQRDDLRVAAAVPLPEPRRLRPGEGAGHAVGLRARARAAGPDRARRRRVLRRAARAVQHRARAEPEEGRVRAARAGQAQFRGRRRDDHRHQRGAGEVRPDRRAGNPDAATTTTTRCTALRAIIGRFAQGAEAGRAGLRPRCARPRQRSTTGSTARSPTISTSASRRTNFDIATLADRPREGRPLSDARPRRELRLRQLRRRRDQPRRRRTTRPRASIGVQLDVPIYQGGFVDSRCAQAISLQDKARQDLEFARAHGVHARADGFTGVTSAVASVKAFEQALVSARVGATSRTCSARKSASAPTSTCCNVQQNVYSTRRDLAQAYFNYLIGVLRLKAVGRHADRAGPRGHQPPAARLTSRASSCGASHAHSRSAAPRCAA